MEFRNKTIDLGFRNERESVNCVFNGLSENGEYITDLVPSCPCIACSCKDGHSVSVSFRTGKYPPDSTLAYVMHRKKVTAKDSEGNQYVLTVKYMIKKK